MTPPTPNNFDDIEFSLKETFDHDDTNIDCESTYAYKVFGEKICKFIKNGANFKDFVEFCNNGDNICIHDDKLACLFKIEDDEVKTTCVFNE